MAFTGPPRTRPGRPAGHRPAAPPAIARPFRRPPPGSAPRAAPTREGPFPAAACPPPQAAVLRKVLGLRPLWRLKAALKPKASAYPTALAICAMLRSVSASIASASSMRHSVR